MSSSSLPSDMMPSSPPHGSLVVLSFLSAVFAVFLALIAQAHTFLSLVLFFFIGLCPLFHLFAHRPFGHHSKRTMKHSDHDLP